MKCKNECCEEEEEVLKYDTGCFVCFFFVWNINNILIDAAWYHKVKAAFHCKLKLLNCPGS